MSFEKLINKHKAYYPFANGNEEFSYYAQQDFEELLRTSPSYVKGVIGDTVVEGLLADVKYGAELEDDKYLLVRHNVILNSGDYFKWKEETFIVTAREHLADEGHESYRLKRCNSSISFTNRRGQKCSIKAHVYNKLFYTEGIDKYTAIAMPDGLCQVIVQYNDDTSVLKRNIKLIVGDQAFMITYVDRATEPGLIQITLSEVMIDSKDDIDDQVAESPYVTGINGKTSLFLGMTGKYKVDEDVIEWTLSGECATIDTTEDREVILKGIQEGSFYLVAICENNTYKKEIKVVSNNFD